MTVVHNRSASYEAVRREPSDAQEYLETLVDVVVDLHARAVIELGVRFGVTTTALLYALERTDGHLWSVDVDRRFNLDDPLWTFIEGLDLDLQVMIKLPSPVDLVLIDTDHTYALTRSEIQAYRSFVRSGGKMILTDTNVENFEEHAPGSEPPYPVRRAVDELLPTSEFSRIELTRARGLTIVTMP